MNQYLVKLLFSAAAAAMLAAGFPAAQAASTAANFNVTVDLTSACEIANAPGDVAFTYQSFQGLDATATTTFDVRCTTSLPYDVSLDATNGAVIGLNYTVSLTTPAVNGTLAGNVGTGGNDTYTIYGTMVSGQPGSCATSPDLGGFCSGSQGRTLTITY